VLGETDLDEYSFTEQYAIAARGVAKSAGAAFVSSIANSARSLGDVSEIEDKSQYPTVSIELENQ
jgi:hypothetical protein